MLKIYLKLALRFLRKSPLLTSINIFSLALGVAACTIIFLFIQEERSFDGFHTQKSQIYRVNEIQSFPGTNTQHVALSMPGMGPNMTTDFPEVLNFSRYLPRGKTLYEKGDIRFTVEKVATVDSTFLDIFDFPLLTGDRNTALDAPNSILISETIAQKFFGKEDPIGKTLENAGNPYKVTGVLKDVSENSHLQFDVLSSINIVYQENPNFDNQWGNNFLNTYLLMDTNADIEGFNKKMPEFMSRHMPITENNPTDVNDFYKVYLQPLEDVHLASLHVEHDYENYRKFNGSYLNIFVIIGIFILLIAGVNFMNLITARASHRYKEVGVRKTVGAQKSQLFNQFVTESVLLGFFSFLLGIVLVFALLPLVKLWMGRSLSFLYLLENPGFLIGGLGITLALGFLAGIYPSLYLASFKTIKILKGENVKSPKSLFRSSLVVLQFGLAIAMIVSTLVVVQQLNYIQNKDIGFNKDHIVLVDMNREANQNFETIKEELLKSSNITGVTASGQRMGNNFHQWGFKFRTDSVTVLTPSNLNVDFDYLEVYDIPVTKGRGFSKEYSSDEDQAFIINQKFAESIGLEDPIGLPAGHAWYPDDTLGTVIGVVGDFNFNSLHYDVNTLAMAVHPEWGYDELSVKINGDNIPAALADIERTWTRLVPSWPFDYSFLDAHFEELYRSDKQMKAVVLAMALLAIFIACMGLFGLAALTMEKRIKEVGIRKILGASLGQIALQLTKIFGLLLVLAFLLFSIPTWILMSRWLENFAFRIQINPLVFVVGFLIAFLIALGTVSYHTLRLAKINPVDTLRQE